MKILREALLAAVLAVVLPVVLAIARPGHASAAGSSCESLQKAMPENATVTLAEVVSAGGFRTPGAAPAAQNGRASRICRRSVASRPL